MTILNVRTNLLITLFVHDLLALGSNFAIASVSVSAFTVTSISGELFFLAVGRITAVPLLQKNERM